ncbi:MULTISPECIES: alginate export family protein [unclassified Rhizobium]|uniref:alginate export family protein n=1 Tax=unclassified Rhizobium TaxID=2613769 RepID=UPI000EAAADA3|nr:MULTISPECIES: alginate export family protein [unclassified Rhizobium]AYG64628.1 alginate export family protein [Rhizobium sp. CCGE531]AYG71110.1 alginate export family protein [Rhizobium sp. CCGE532]
MTIERYLVSTAVLLALSATAVYAADPSAPAKRPAIKSNRWQEDWSVLAVPALRTEPLDSLKYLPLSSGDPGTYVSFGVNLRDRFETNNAPSFGIGGIARDNYVIQRAQFHIDLHLFDDWQIFTQFEDDRAFGKESVGPADADKMDLRLAFVSYSHDFDAGTFKARVGRQDFAFDLQRFVSSRDGPNVRQSFDAVWADWETGPWRFIGFVSQPVQYRNDEAFDDTSNGDFRFSTLRVERQVLGTNELSAYYSLYQKRNAHYLDGSGDEDRHIFDTRFAGSSNGLDWDLEGMGQVGSVGDKDIRAWAIGARGGYTFEDASWTPRLGLQFDMASGDHNPGDGTVGTFNPLFPNGYYFTLAGYTGYANLIHLKPSITVKPTDKMTLMAAVGLQWRQTTADAIYVQPNQPLAGTAGRGGAWSGAYGQIRLDYAFNANLTGAIEAVHYEIGDAIRRAGGHGGNYLGAQLSFAW